MTQIGILGAGQLGRMLALSGYPLGLEFRTYDNTLNFTDFRALEQFASGLDLVTYEFENVPVAAARFLETRLSVFPSVDALAAAQDRLDEKTLFQSLGIPTPTFLPVDSDQDLETVLQHMGLPVMLKTRRLGYDGKGQAIATTKAELAAAWDRLGKTQLIAESVIDFERELSLIAVRGKSGETACYPLVQNYHSNGILRVSLAPLSDVSEGLVHKAESYAAQLLNRLQYVGVMVIEFFQCGQVLLANEFAPRVHNSGHWSIEGAETSQFENHLRAILGLPLGSTQALGYSAMWNIIGTVPDLSPLWAMRDVHVHLYGKKPFAGRKLGHITARAPSSEALQETMVALRPLLWDESKRSYR